MSGHPVLVRNFLESSAGKFPGKIALISENQRLTYSEIDTSANKLANALIDCGVKRGDRVVVFFPNSIAAVISIFGILKASATFVVINPTTKINKLTNIINNCGATTLIIDHQKIDYIPGILIACKSLKFIVFTSEVEKKDFNSTASTVNILNLPGIERTFSGDRPPINNIDLDLACLIYTSGSTGDPKGVMCDHSNITFATDSIIQYLGNVSEDIVINVLPLSFDYGLYQLLMVFRFGGTLVLEKFFAFPIQVLELIEKEKVTGLPGVPTIFAILLGMDLSKFDFRNLRYITNTAAALPSSHIQGLQQRFPYTKIYSMYGLTETKRALYLPPEKINNHPGSVGIPIPGTEAWVENEKGQRVPSGEMGELVIRGRHVMRGYWGDDTATAQRFKPGLLPGERLCYTGDLFRTDEEGYFYFIARKDDIIKSRGEKVAPKEIENILYLIDGVIESAVIGIPDPILGEAVLAFIVSANPALTDVEVLSFCRLSLEDFMVPQRIVFLKELPKTSSGKIDKRNLAEQYKNNLQSVII